MSNLPFVTNRKRKTSEPQQPTNDDEQKAQRFLADYVSTSRQLNEAHQALYDRDNEIATLEHRINYLQNELSRCQTARDEYQAGYAELKAQLAVLITAVEQNYQSFSHVADAAMRSIKESMARAGVDSFEQVKTEGPVAFSDADMAKIAERFGVDSEEKEQAR